MNLKTVKNSVQIGSCTFDLFFTDLKNLFLESRYNTLKSVRGVLPEILLIYKGKPIGNP